MKLKESYGAFGVLMKKHGFNVTKRGLVWLAMVAIFIRETGEEPTVPKVMEHWKMAERTAYRESAAWRKLSGGADVGEVARSVIAAYSASLLAEASPGVLAFELGSFVPGQ